VVIDNAGSTAQTQHQVDDFWDRLVTERP